MTTKKPFKATRWWIPGQDPDGKEIQVKSSLQILGIG